MGVLTCAHIHSIELDRMISLLSSPYVLSNAQHPVHSGRGWSHQHVRRYSVAHITRRVPWIILHWCLPHYLRIQYECQQSGIPGSCRLLPLHPLVGPQELAVRSLYAYVSLLLIDAHLEHGL